MAGRWFRVATVMALALVAVRVQAATYTWNVTSGTWTDNTAWSPTTSAAGTGPVSGDTIVYGGAQSQTIDLAGATQTVSQLTTNALLATPLTLTATNGSLVINGSGDLNLYGTTGTAGTLTYDFSGLSGFTFNAPTRQFLAGWAIGGSVTGTTTTNFARQGSGTNTITVTTFQTGASGNTNTLGLSILNLGKVNNVNAQTVYIGSYSNSGSVAFGSGITNGTLVLRGTGGGPNRVTNMWIGNNSSGNSNRSGSGWMDLTNGSIDALTGTMALAVGNAANTSVANSGLLTMTSGTIDTQVLIMGWKPNSGTNTLTATLNQSGGLVLSGTIRFGEISAALGNGGAQPNFQSTYNLSSGTLRSGLITTIQTTATSGTMIANAASVRRIAWTGGTIANYDASTDLLITGSNANAGYTMQLVLGSTTTPQVFNADSGRTITIGANAVISGTGLLQKDGAGTLRINTAATYTGSTLIATGTIQLGVASGLPPATALTLNPGSGTTATFDLNGFNQTVASLASSGAGAAVIDVAATGTSTLTVGGDNSSTSFAGRLVNSGGATSRLALTKNGTGTLTLTGTASSIAGALAVNNGKVTIDPGSGGSFATGRLQIAPGAGISATIEVLSGSNTFGTSAGISGLGDNSATGTSTLNIGGGSTTMQVTSNRFLIGNKGPATLSLTTGGFTIAGTNDVVVGGDQTFTIDNASGVVTVSGGTLSITGAGNLILGRNGTSGTSTSGANGTINLDGGVFASIRPITMATGTAMGTGTVNFNGGTLRALGTNADFIAVTTANVKNGGAVIDTNSFDVTIAQPLLNAGSGGLTKLNAGTLTLNGSNSYAGNTAVNGGTLKAGSVNAFGAGTVSVASGATLDLNSLGVGNAITNNGGTVSNAGSYAGTQTLNGAATFGNLGGTLVVANGGTATFAGALAAATSINTGGAGVLGDAGSISAAGLTNNGTFTIDRTGSSSLATIFSGNGTLVKQGSGIVNLTGLSSFAGPTLVNAGALAVNGSLGNGVVTVNTGAILAGSGTIGGLVTIAGGTLSPGNSPGIMTLDALLASSTATILMEITGTTPGAGGYDQVVLSGSLTYGGTLSLDLSQTFADGTTFDLFKNFASYIGNFGTVQSIGAAYTGLTFTQAGEIWTSATLNDQYLQFSQATGDLTVFAAVPEPATLTLLGSAIAVAAGHLARRRRGRGIQRRGSRAAAPVT